MIGIYKKYDNPICEGYKAAEKYFEFNKFSKVLHTIKISMPSPPELSSISGFGKAARDQRWRREEVPFRLRELEVNYGSLEEIYEQLELHAEDYEDEIRWIKGEWQKRLNGFWFYINGVPTYITGWHYFYLTYWKLDIGYPEYRDRDREFFLFAYFAYTDTRLPSGKDMHRRLCLGFNYPKHRREGATYKAACINYEIISRMANAHGGIQSLDKTSAKKVFVDKMVTPWKKMAFFFRPYFTSDVGTQSKLVFDTRISKGANVTTIRQEREGLNSYIDYATSPDRRFYDGDKLYFYHDDETAKLTAENCYSRHEVVRKTLVQGNSRRIHGFTIKTSTVGEMSGGGGKHFYSLCKDSMWEKRNANGMTVTGLYNLFIPSYVGLDDFIDIFGNSIIENPGEDELWRIPLPTRNVDGKLIGAKEFLENQRLAFLQSGDDNPEAQAKYEENVRQFPFDFDECFITAGTGSGLNLVKIVNRMKELQFGKSLTRRGNFYWQSLDGKVIWDDDANGRWTLSLAINEDKQQEKFKTKVWETNRFVETWMPKYPNAFTACGDPYAFNTTEGNRISKGGGAVFWHQDKILDPDTKDMKEWESYRFVCTYLSRPPDPDDYAEDMLMMSVYFGAMMYPEINVPLLWTHFKRRGYLGYLKYFVGPDGRKHKTPGFFNKGSIPQSLFLAHKKYIEHHIHRERHIDILEQQYAIRGIEELTDYDLFVAAGGAILGSEIVIKDKWDMHHTTKSIDSFVRARSY